MIRFSMVLSQIQSYRIILLLRSMDVMSKALFDQTANCNPFHNRFMSYTRICISCRPMRRAYIPVNDIFTL